MDFTLWGMVVILLLGLAVGSFLNVLIYRLPRNLGILGRSLCSHCKRNISWYDNIPLISFIVLSGRCRFCRSPIGWQYPVVELITAILFVLVLIVFPQENLLSIIYYLFILSALIVIFFIDLKHGIIPDKIIYPAILVSFLFSLEVGPTFNFQLSTFNYLLSALGASLFFLLLILITKGRGMGFGDVKLAFLMGLFLGWPNLVLALYISFLIGGVVAAALLFTRIKKFGQTVPFGPFLATGTLMAFFFGQAIINSFFSRWIA